MQSGGMDQTISVMGELGKAKLVQFNPIRTQDVQIPQGYVFVVANSLTPSPKLQHKGTKYNKRVVECRFVLYILAQRLGVAATYKDCKFKHLLQL